MLIKTQQQRLIFRTALTFKLIETGVNFLDAEKECLTNPAGNGYRGTMSRAASGRPCMNWIHVDNYTISASMNVDDISQAENFCRQVPLADWNGPSCVTKDEAGMVRLERCDVPYCRTVSCVYRNNRKMVLLERTGPKAGIFVQGIQNIPSVLHDDSSMKPRLPGAGYPLPRNFFNGFIIYENLTGHCGGV